MKIAVTVPSNEMSESILNEVKEMATMVEDEQQQQVNSLTTLTLTCEPGIYKQICEFVERMTEGRGTVVTLLLKDLADE